MPSGRELTSRLSSEHPGESSTFYVPHVFDFVSIFKPADYYGGLFEVPPLYLEPLAVEQSIVVGQGASFTAYKKAIPQAPAEPVTIKMDGMIITHSPQKAWPRNIIYKVARVAFTQIGTPTPQTRQAMKAALMEVYSLVHGPLREHPNIIKLLALAWGPNYFNPSHRLPVLVVEFADYGNLAQLQEKKDLDSLTKCRLAVDIGEGLSMLHRCGIIHGDVKSENVLIFSDPEKEFIAKLSDFGFSTVAEAADADELVGGTRPWKAPETNSPVQKHLLQATDTYSYGLLVWRLAIDGKDPFHLWVSSSRCGESYLEHLEQIKADDEPVRKASLDTWFISYISQKHADLTVDPLTQALSSLQLAEAAIESAQTEGTMSMTTWETIMNSLGPCLKVPELWQVVSGPVLQYAQQNSFYGRLPSTLSHCISADPTKRNLRKAITTLTGGKSPDSSGENTTRAENILLHMSYKHHTLSWQQMRALEPAVQSFIFNCLKAKVEDNLSKNLINTPDCFILASYYINGYGTKVDFKEAMRLIQQSSNMEYDHHSSRTYAYRIFKALDPNYVPNSDTISNLSVMAVRGARMAAADLKDVAPEEYLKIESLIRDVHAGVGADFFYDEQMLYIGTYWQWINTFDNPQVLVERLSKFDQIAEYRVNKRGDKILHLAASAGKIEAIETLLNNFPSFSINQRNDQGETPLLYACRAGQRKTVLRLLELGADAAIIAANGESCLHWLVSFNDNEICPIGEALIKSGAGLRVYTRERIEHSQLRAKIDVAFQFPGTPLNWAVHHDRPCIIKFILDQASDASVCLDWPTDLLGRSTPLEFAAFFHHVECLKLMMDALDRAGMDYSLSPIITAGTNAADVFSMVLRNGSSYRDRLHEFLDLCLKKSKDIVFATGVGGLDTHLLYYAVSEGHDEVVEYLLSAKVSELVESLDIQCGEGQTCPGAYNASDINRPARGDRRTPVLEAIRWNRKHIVETLVASGADPKAAARNPFSAKEMNWTGLHIFAAAGHDENHSELVSFLIQAGLPIDGIPNSPDGTQQSPETPFLVTIQHNAFNLATTLLYFGANPNALQTSAGFFSLEHPTTVLGHIVASSSQHTIPRLRYLLETCPKSGAIDFIVEPTRGLSALHRAAWAHKGIMYRTPDAGQRKYLPREDYDFVMNQNIIQELLQHWGNRDVHLDRRCGIHGRTALHLAVDAGNIMGVEVLLSNKADRFVSDDFGMPPIELGREKSNAARDESSEERGIYDSIIKLLLR